jgi:lysophospholipase L1-like esterase
VKAPEFAVAALSATVALVVFLALGEVALRIYTRHAIYYDVEMTRYANDLKLESPNPRIGHVHRPGASSLLMGVPVQINSAGLRDDEYPLERGASRRIAFLGDSLTFGWGVAKEDTFESLLERELAATGPTEILNFGTGNYNTEQQVNLFLEKGLAFAPDEVVVFYFINDAEPTPRRSRWAFLGRSRMATFVWSRVKAVKSRLFPSASYQEYYTALYREDQPGWLRTKDAFLTLRELCRKEGIGLRVVLLPELHDPQQRPFAREYGGLARFLREHDIAVLDLSPHFADETEPLRLWVAADDAHPNALAHRRIAILALPFLRGAPDEPAQEDPGDSG